MIVALRHGKNTEEIMKTSINKLTTVEGLFLSETLLAYAPYFTA
jgi:preprotein translocase subunit SecY